MQPQKIVNFEKRNGLGTFAQFRTLSKGESQIVNGKIKKSLQITETISPCNLAKLVQDMGTLVDGANADKNGFSFFDLLQELGIDAIGNVYLNWNQFEAFDKIEINLLARSFGDIWYPSSDDLDLVDEKIRWILSIHHSGVVRFLKINSQKSTR